MLGFVWWVISTSWWVVSWGGSLGALAYALQQTALFVQHQVFLRAAGGPAGGNSPAGQPQNLRARYSGARSPAAGAAADDKKKPQEGAVDAKWALVTGASSGVGLALSHRMAQQGFSVCLVALDDELLDAAVQELADAYGGRVVSTFGGGDSAGSAGASKKEGGEGGPEFRRIGADLGRHDGEYDYLDVIAQATADIHVQCVFNNAGYIVLRSFPQTSDAAVRANHECNVTAPIRLSRHFMADMRQAGLRGCVAFTSSAQAYMPAPASTLYNSGKADLAMLAASLAIEGATHGIDVCAIMSGPIRTRFNDKMEVKLDILKFYDVISDTPQTVADVLINSIGIVAWRDSSLYAACVRLFNWYIIPVNAFVRLLGVIQVYVPDFRHESLR